MSAMLEKAAGIQAALLSFRQCCRCWVLRRVQDSLPGLAALATFKMRATAHVTVTHCAPTHLGHSSACVFLDLLAVGSSANVSLHRLLPYHL